MKDLVQNVEGLNLHCGLNIFVETSSNAEEEADAVSKNWCEELLNLITFTTGAFCERAKLQNSVYFESAQVPRFKYRPDLSQEQPLLGATLPIVQDEFGEVFKKYFEHTERRRLFRALSWLRSGINEENAFDEFTFYWIGLEVLRGILRRHLKLQKRNPKEWDGVKHLYEVELKFGRFDDVMKLRKGLLHGFSELGDQFGKDINQFTTPLRKTLYASLGRILSISPATWASISSRNVRRVRMDPWHVILGEIENMPQRLEEVVESFPCIKPDASSAKYLLNEKGELKVSTSVQHHFIGPPNAKWHVKSVEAYGDQDSGIMDSNLKYD
jgi:hypothetical protein